MSITFIPAVIGAAILAPALAARRRVSIRNATNTTLTLVSPVTAVLPPDSEPLVIEGANAANQIDGTFAGVPAGIGQEVAGEGSAVVDDSEGVSGLTLNGIPLSEYKARAFRFDGQESFQWGMLINADASRYAVITRSEVRISKSRDNDSSGFVSLVGIKSVSPTGSEVIFFGGDNWKRGTDPNQDSASDIVYNTEFENGDFLHIKSTGETPPGGTYTPITSTTVIKDQDGVGHTVTPGDIVILYSNQTPSRDTASITTNHIWVDY